MLTYKREIKIMNILIRRIQSFFLFSMIALGLSNPAFSKEVSPETMATLGPKACANCHKSSIRAWKPTHHFKTFKALTRNKEAKVIAKKMGIKRMKSGSDCLTCHFTSKPKKGKTKVVAGISCESCHGPAKGWMDIHSDFGGKGVKAADETPEHKVTRFAESVKNGMIRPSNLYDVGKNCYSCHTVPNEKLVNTGGHTAGSDFELVKWSQGEVRHNVWYDDKVNGSPAVERLRMMYIIGKALDLEYALRGLAKATEEQTYYTSMVKRQQTASADLQQVADKLKVAEITAIVTAASSAEVKVNNLDALNGAADKVGAAAQAVAKKFDGAQFAAIDGLLPAAADYKGAVFQP
jgi:hypothetical protein